MYTLELIYILKSAKNLSL